MRKTIRITAIVAVVLIVIVVAVRFLVPAEKWRQLALEQFEKHTGMQATAAGASIQFPWPVGLRLEQVELTDERDETAYERLNAGVDEVVVSAELMSLIRRKPRVNEIRLVRPRVELWLRSAAEVASAPDAGSPAAAAPPDSAAATDIAGGTAAVLSLLAIEDGDLRLHQADGSEVHLQDVDQRFSLSVAEDGSVQGTLSASVQSSLVPLTGRPEPLALPALELEMGLEANLQALHGTVRIERLVMGGIELRGPVGWDLSGDSPALDAALEVQAALPEVHERFGSLASIPAPWDEQVALLAGELTGNLRFQGSLPASGGETDALVAGLSGDGGLRDLRASILGEEGFAAELAWSVESSVVRLRDVALTAPGIRATGGLSAPATGQGNATGTLQLDVALQQLRAVLPGLVSRLPAEMTEGLPEPELWPEVGGRITGQVDVDLPLGQELDPAQRPVVCRLRPDGVTLRPAEFTESFSITGGTLVATLVDVEASDLMVSGPGLQGVFEGSVGGWPETLDGDLRARLERLDVDALQAAMPVPPETAWRAPWGVGTAYASGAGDGEATVAKPPENLDLRFTATAAQVHTKGYTLRDVRAEGTLVEQQLEVPVLEGKLGAGALSGRAGVDWTQDPPQWKADAKADALPAGALLEPFASLLADALTTEVSGTMEFRGPVGAEPAALRAELDGEGSVLASSGQLLTEPILGTTISRFAAAAGESFRRLDFDRLTAGIRVDQGRVQFDKLLIDAPTTVRASGWVSLAGRCDYRLEVRLPPNVTPELGELTPLADLLRDEEKRIAFGVAVTGPAAKPKVEIDMRALEERARAGAANATRRELDRLLEDELGLGTEPDSAATSPEDELKQKAEDAVQDLLRGFGGKKDKGGGGG